MAERILFHFDTDKNYLSVNDFIITATSLQKVSNELVHKCFANAQYELSVCAAEDGSFKDWFIGVLMGGILVGGASDYVSGFIKGITGKNPSEYGENHGELVKDMIVGFYSQDTEQLKVPQEMNLDIAIKAKSDFYTMCSKNTDIKGIGFTNDNNFIIKRPDLPRYISQDIIREIPDTLVLQELIIYKPVNIPSDNQWSFKDNKTKQNLNANISDEEFKNGFLLGQYPLKSTRNNDIIVALVRYERQMINGEEKIIGKKIDTVFKFNDTEIKPIPKQLLFNLPHLSQPQDEAELDLFDIR